MVIVDPYYNWPYRCPQSTGLWMLLIPLLHVSLTDPKQGNYPYDASGLLALTLMICYFHSFNRIMQSWLFFAIVMFVRSKVSISIAYYYSLLTWQCVCLWGTVIGLYKLLVPKFAESFTGGEFALCVQLGAWAIFESLNVLTSNALSEYSPATIYAACLVLCAFVALPLMNYMPPLLCAVAAMSVASLMGFQLCQPAEEYPLQWARLMLGRPNELEMFYFWMVLLFTAIASLAIGQEKEGDTRMFRKWFHLLTVIVFLSGSSTPDLLWSASVGAMVILCVLEIVRYNKNLGSLGAFLNRTYAAMGDSKDEGPLYVSNIFLLIGVSLPYWMPSRLHLSNTLLFKNAGIISVGVGDAAAALGGQLFGRTRWTVDPNNERTIEGTLTGIAAQLALIWWFELGSVMSLVVLVPVVLTSLVEAFLDQIDNLCLPLIFLLGIELGSIAQTSFFG